MSTMTIGIKKVGKIQVIHAPSVDESKQRLDFHAWNVGDVPLPDGIVAVQTWEKVWETKGIDKAARKRREAGELEPLPPQEIAEAKARKERAEEEEAKRLASIKPATPEQEAASKPK